MSWPTHQALLSLGSDFVRVGNFAVTSSLGWEKPQKPQINGTCHFILLNGDKRYFTAKKATGMRTDICRKYSSDVIKHSPGQPCQSTYAIRYIACCALGDACPTDTHPPSPTFDAHVKDILFVLYDGVTCNVL